MKRLSLLFAMAIFCANSLMGQTVYLLNYNQMIENELTATEGLFFQQADDDSGFLRIKFIDPINKKPINIQYDLVQQDIVMPNGELDTTRFFVIADTPNVFSDFLPTKMPQPIILFTLNTGSGFYEPSNLITRDKLGNIAEIPHAEFKATEIPPDKISQEMFGQFFYEDEAFMKKFFRNVTKDMVTKLIPKGTKMHLLIIADTVKETDPHIGDISTACSKDVDRITVGFAAIAAELGISLEIKPIMGKNYGKRSLETALKELSPKEERDIVIFYYSGHGYRKENDKRRYPYLDLRKNNTDDYLKETMNLEDIYETIKKKKAKINLVWADCCNSYVTAAPIPGKPIPVKKNIKAPLSVDNLVELFSKRINLIAAAADSSQTAASNKDFGGFFSYNLDNMINEHSSASSSNPNWMAIMQATRSQTYKMSRRSTCNQKGEPEKRCNQSPCYRFW